MIRQLKPGEPLPAITRSLQRSGTPTRERRAENIYNYRSDVTPHEVARLYLSGLGIETLAERFRTSNVVIRSRLNAAGVKPRRPGRPSSRDPRSTAVRSVTRLPYNHRGTP